MRQEEWIEKIADFVAGRLEEMAKQNPAPEHDPVYRWEHTQRVAQYGGRIAREEGADTAEIQAAIRVGQMVRKGAADTWDEVATSLAGMDSFNGSGDNE